MSIWNRAACVASMGLAMLAAGSALPQDMFSLFVGSRPEEIDRMIRIAELKDGDVVVDLGSGDGRIVLAAALTHSKVSGWGVDIDSKLVDQANAFALEEGVAERVRFVHGDVFDADLSKVDVIFMWLYPELQRLLRPKILAEARPGTRIVTNLFDLGSWRPDELDPDRRLIRLWIVPARVAGNWDWTLTIDGVQRSYSVLLEQHFQQVEGVIRVDARRRELLGASLRGDQLSFSLSMEVEGLGRVPHVFSGTVRGGRIEGTVRYVLAKRGAQKDEAKQGVEDLAREQPWVAARTRSNGYFQSTRP